ncbi:MAG: hypothetical protein M3Y60_04440 [Bacteroidota bacterium]|nr:hypothetical protein [Bacteroidota bacterium]
MKKIIIAIVALYFAACSPGTQITGSWKNADMPVSENVNTIFVTALTGRANARQAVENDLAAAMEKKGYKTIKSIDVMPPTFTGSRTPDREEMLSKIQETGADAILTVALIDEETESRYTPGNYSYAPMPRFGYYGTFWGYYNNWYPTLHDPGYYQQDKVYFIETNLYDAKSEQLLWSAQSQSYNPRNLPDFADEFSEVVVSRLEEDGILNNGESTELAKERDE